jgi:predicted  nucleic acid-binding Zn-ribbon protein
MTKMLDPIEEAQRALRDEIAMLREVNRAQADNYTSLARQLADREEQLRKAQERIRAAEAERDKTVLAYALQERRAIEAEAELDRAWNEAIEAAAHCVADAARRHREASSGKFLRRDFAAQRLASYAAQSIDALVYRIRSLAKEAGE